MTLFDNLVPNSARLKIREHLQSKDFNRFVQNPMAFENDHAIAYISSEQSMNFGFDCKINRIVFLSADTVNTHPDFKSYTTEDWFGIQYLIDIGEHLESKPHHRRIFELREEKPWQLVLKQTIKSELYMVSYHRIDIGKMQKLQKLRKERTESGGP